MTGNLRKREKICTKADMSRKSSLTISQTVLNFVMYVEKNRRKSVHCVGLPEYY